MKKFIAILSATALLVFAGVSFTACDEADEAIDCAKICNRYDECVDSDYDEAACRNRCEDNADNDEAFADKADACESCIDDRSCSESFPCIDECFGIVP